jgi:hypothetical protein
MSVHMHNHFEYTQLRNFILIFLTLNPFLQCHVKLHVCDQVSTSSRGALTVLLRSHRRYIIAASNHASAGCETSLATLIYRESQGTPTVPWNPERHVGQACL